MKEILKNKKVLIPIATIILAVIILGVSYAYYVANVTENNKTESVIQTKELKIAFDGTQEIEANSITPGWSAEKKFTVENLTNSKTAFNIYMQNITNEFDNELTYSLYETDSTGNVIETLIDGEVLPQTNADKSYLQSDIELNPQPTKKYYTLKIEFENKATSQNEYQGAHFRATVGVDAAARKDVAVISGERIDASSITDGSSVTRQFNILNYSTETQRYKLKLSDVVNTYASGLKYSLKKNGVEVIASTTMPTTDTILLSAQTLAAGATDTYEMTITYDTTQANVDGFRLLANEVNTFTANIKIDTKTEEYNEVGQYTYTATCSGTYKLEAWGAQGGSTLNGGIGGKGAYAKGLVHLNANEILYVYIGKNAGTYNGGGALTKTDRNRWAYGGGASDVRYFGENYIPNETELAWNSSLGLASRILVAAGGGGAQEGVNGGAGGTLHGMMGGSNKSGDYRSSGGGGTQISGGTAGTCTDGAMGANGNANVGSFGKGANAITVGFSSAGGSGYYGGGSSSANRNWNGAAGGGSSYVSGCNGCVAIKSADEVIARYVNEVQCTEEMALTTNECSKHYSGKVFDSIDMIDGNSEMPSPSGGVETGHSGNGFIRITSISCD